jgi:hypothetical protein
VRARLTAAMALREAQVDQVVHEFFYRSHRTQGITGW